jgi:hypothetical protein
VSGVFPGVLAGLLLTVVSAPVRSQDPPPAVSQPQQPVVSSIRIEGDSVYAAEDLQRRHGLILGERLKASPDAIAAEIRRRYASDGYTFAEVTASIDADGALIITIDEGRIDDVEFRGVDADVSSRLRERFSIRSGDIFNRGQALRALETALEQAGGAIVRVHGQTFTLVRDHSRRVLQVNLRTRSQRSGVFVGTQGREDWYSPVDGFNPAIGFQSTIFDAKRFNHTYWTGFVSYKFAREDAGYAFGLERPFFADGVVQVGAGLHDLTGSDDQWRLTNLEQSLVGFTFRNSFRDYYRRKGWQVHAAVRPLEQHEWLAAWRDESHAALVNETGYGLFRDDHPFRPNPSVLDGDLRALIVGYTFDSRSLAREAVGERFRRHQVDDLFGSAAARDHGARIEWKSELAPAAFEHDFDFNRHVLNARAWLQTSPSRLLSARMIAGFSNGTVPPQRVFGLGGVGTVHGYAFKEAIGERMLLLNGEFAQRFGRSGFAGLAFIDAGRVYRPLAGSREAWLRGVGVGLEFSGGARVEFGWRLDDIPRSLQVLFRLNPGW